MTMDDHWLRLAAQPRFEDDHDCPRARLLERVNRIAEELHRPLSPNNPYQQLLERLLAGLQLPAGLLYGRGADAQPLLRAGQGLPAELAARLAAAPERLCADAEPMATAASEPAAGPPALRTALREAGFAGLIRLPLQTERCRAGWLELPLPQPLDLGPGGRAALRLIGRHLALALANAEALLDARAGPAAGDALVDPLTGLYASRYFRSLLAAEVERARRYGGGLALLLLDIDDFQGFNRRHGHAEGDRLLAAIGRLLQAQLRKVDIACRYGGEEFIVILPGCEQAVLHGLAERVRRDFGNRPFALQAGGSAPVSVSIGAVCYRPGVSLQALIAELDQALRQAKHGGKDRVAVRCP